MADYAKPFEDMAARIGRIDEREFAGAIVVVPPGEGEPIAFLTTDPRPDLLQFLAAAKTRVELRESEVMAQAQMQDPWGQRR